MAGVQFWVLMVTLTAAVTDSIDVFVSKSNGIDQENCGSDPLPACKSLEYVLQNEKAILELTIKLDGGENMLNPYTYFVNKSFHLDKNITIRKAGNARPAIVMQSEDPYSDYLFNSSCEKAHTLEVDGIRFNKTSLISIMRTAMVKITNCLFHNAHYFVQTNTSVLEEKYVVLQISNCKFNNSFLRLYNTQLKIDIINSTMHGEYEGMDFLIASFQKIDFKMSNCIYKYDGGLGFDRDLLSTSHSSQNITITNSQFISEAHNNRVNAIWISTCPSLFVVIRYCEFKGYNDAAIKISTANSVTITHSNFKNNYGFSGGAVSITNSNVTIVKTVFLNNTGRNGGAIYWAAAFKSLLIKNSMFISNTAYSGGSIYAMGDALIPDYGVELRNVFLTGISELFHHSSILIFASTGIILRNVSMVVQTTSPNWPVTGFACSEMCVNKMKRSNASYDFKYTCPENYHIEPIFADNPGEKVLSKISCIRCKRKTYTEQKGSMRIVRRENFSIATKFDLKCQKCPLGANCDEQIISRGNFWGYKSTAKHGLKFMPCPSLYCCSAHGAKCISYNTCNSNRKGILCGSCMDGYRVNYFDGKCVAKSSCWKFLFWLLYILYVSLYIILLLYYKDIFLFALKYYKNYKDKRSKRDTLTDALIGKSGDRISQYEDECDDLDSVIDPSDVTHVTCRHSEDIMESCDHSAGKSANCSVSDGKYLANPNITRNITAMITIIFFFYQIETLLRIKQRDEKNLNFLDDIRKAVSSVLNLQFMVTKFSKICPREDLTSIGKEIVQSSTVLAAMTLLLLFLSAKTLYFAQTKRKKESVQSIENAKPVQVKIKLCIMQLALLGFTGISAFCLKMMNCVNINDTHHLYIQGDVVCYSWWQCLIMVFFSIWIVPFPLSTFLSVRMLTKETVSVTQFYNCFFCPPYATYQYILKRNTSFDFDSTELPVENKEKDSILELFTKPYRKSTSEESVINWEAVVLIRRLILSALCICIINPVFRMLVTFPTLLVSLLHHWYKSPFYNSMLNRMEAASLSLLMLFNIFDLIWALDYLYDLSNLPGFELISTVFTWVRNIILLLPPFVILGILLMGVVKKLVAPITNYRNRTDDENQ